MTEGPWLATFAGRAEGRHGWRRQKTAASNGAPRRTNGCESLLFRAPPRRRSPKNSIEPCRAPRRGPTSSTSGLGVLQSGGAACRNGAEGEVQNLICQKSNPFRGAVSARVYSGEIDRRLLPSSAFFRL